MISNIDPNSNANVTLIFISVLVSIATSIGTFIYTIISSYRSKKNTEEQYKLAKEQSDRKFSEEWAKLNLKVDTIWEFQMRRAKEIAKENGLLIENSPIRVAE